jgi:hypothetical protein
MKPISARSEHIWSAQPVNPPLTVDFNVFWEILTKAIAYLLIPLSRESGVSKTSGDWDGRSTDVIDSVRWELGGSALKFYGTPCITF